MAMTIDDGQFRASQVESDAAPRCASVGAETANPALRRLPPFLAARCRVGFLSFLLLVAPKVLLADDLTAPPAERGRAVTYRNDHPQVPWSIHIVTVDRSRTDYELEIGRAS